MANKFEKMFVFGALKAPASFPNRDAFCAGAKMVAPKELFNDGYCTAVENQGQKPWCAAYSATSYAESILWRVNGYPEQIDPAAIYGYAKTVDGDPNGDGTTLNAVLKALIAKHYFNGDMCKIRTFVGSTYGRDPALALADLKMAVHRFGTCIVGFTIDSSWYTPNKKGVIVGGGTVQGGHAVTICGYDEGGVLILNSWGADWGHDGKAYMPNSVFNRQFMYGACLTHALDGLE